MNWMKLLAGAMAMMLCVSSVVACNVESESNDLSALSPEQLFNALQTAEHYACSMLVENTFEERTIRETTLIRDGSRVRCDDISYGQEEIWPSVRYWDLNAHQIWWSEYDGWEVGGFDEFAFKDEFKSNVFNDNLIPSMLFDFAAIDANYDVVDGKYVLKQEIVAQCFEDPMVNFSEMPSELVKLLLWEMESNGDSYVLHMATEHKQIRYNFEVKLEFTSAGIDAPDVNVRITTGLVSKPVDPDGLPPAEDPYLYNHFSKNRDLGLLLQKYTKAMGRLKQDSIHTIGLAFKNSTPNGANKLFDGVKTEADYQAHGSGMMSAQMSDNACVLFDLTVPVKVGAYVFTTGGDTAGNLQVVPVSWYLYATNNKNAAEAMRQDGASAQDVYSNYMWTKLDYVENGGIKDTNWTANGYEIDPNEQQHSYRYFCLVICSTRGETLQLGEFELYSK